MAGQLEGKVAVITGAASGIGAATARLFIREGASVVMADVQDDRGAKMVEELGPSAVFQHTDVTNEREVGAAVDAEAPGIPSDEGGRWRNAERARSAARENDG
jgi:NAD(P)-dependent dehydrogenase (short-subunit alcohol dehydrogenase family)